VSWQPILLLGLAWFLVGGVVAAVKAQARVVAIVLGVVALAFAVGGVLWLLPAS
jgi:hypothetical protein